jgi:anti-anti-sigma factor
VIDPAAGKVEYGGFGHPAPLIVGDAGRTRFLPISPSRPLGVGQEPPALRSARLAAGEVLLLYSDGLVERPGRSLHDGMEQLAAVASAAMWEAPAQSDPDSLADRLCGLVVERLTRSGYSDDVTVLAAEMRVEPHRPLALELPADGMWLRGIRRALDEWLHAVGAHGEDVPTVHLAVVEAATNCVEHAYREAGGWMWLDVVLDGDGRLRATVTDHGRWRSPPDGTDYRGRGMRLINSLMESVDVHSSGRGTTVTMARTLRHPTVFLLARRAPPAASSAEDFGTGMRQGARPCLVVSGPVDMVTAGALRNRISELSRGGMRPIDVDLAAVTQLASAGVQVLYDCARTAEGAALVRLLVPVHCPARFVLELTGLDEVLELLPERRR